MALRSNFKEEDVFKEGILLGLVFAVVGSLMLTLFSFYDNPWLLAIGSVFLAIAGIALFMVLYISFFNEKRSEVMMFLWNELLYLFVGIPLASICVLILPVTIYILMFGGDPGQTWKFSVIFTLSLMIASLIYGVIKLWIENRKSGLIVPEKIDKGPIEQILYRIPSVED